jgi:hypothetical protein
VNHHREQVGERKRQSIDRILANDVYTPESGLFANLRQALLKLSSEDLLKLELIVKVKMESKVQRSP